ncbi:MAG TPA: hypothetical protein VNO32_16700, partial [Candidatus Acidoferrum sp.]|nr:hypothetical protein [Candidatus Acidoferrum sp.]
YNAANLLPGTYDISVSAPGFETEVQSGVTLTVGSVQVLNLVLKVGNVTQRIVVTGEVPVVQLANATISWTVNSTTVQELPLNGRDWTQLATLQPGVVSAVGIQFNTDSLERGNHGFGNEMSISGGRATGNTYRIDGINANNYGNGGPGGVLGGALGVDAIQEFSVLADNYSAEYGRTSGGVINAITRSGTNQFHGDAYEFLRNSALDARNYFDGPTIPSFRRNQFGGSGGGSIRKDKTFFFGDYEGIRQSLGFTTHSFVFSNDARNGILHNADGTTTDLSTDPNFLKVKAFMALWPAPNGPVIGLGNSADNSTVGQQVTQDNFAAGRVDQKFSDRDSLFGSFQWEHGTTVLPDALGAVNLGQNAGRLLIAVEETHIISTTFINSVRIGFNRSSGEGGFPVSAILPAASDPSLAVLPGAMVAPGISVSGLTKFAGLGVGSFTRFFGNSFQGYDDAALIKGIHSFKFGVAVERMQLNVFQPPARTGTIGFTSVQAFMQDQPRTASEILPGNPLRPFYLRDAIFGGYFEDDVHWRSNLTINLGIRYEMSGVPTEKYNRLAVLPSLTATAVRLGSPLFNNPTKRNFEPRVGFAWDPFRNGKTSVRAGFGMYDVLPLPYEYMLSIINEAPYVLTGSIPAGTAAQGSFFAGDITQPPGALSSSVSKPLRTRETYIEQNPKRNYVMQWNLNIQRQLGSDLTASVAYVGSRGVHMEYHADDSNSEIPTQTAAGGLLFLTPPAAAPQVLNPNFGRIDPITWGRNSFYDALEVQIQKRISHGFQIQGSYTWSKSIDEGSGSVLGDPYENSVSEGEIFFPKFDRAVSDFNIAHNLVINGTWMIPTPQSFQGPASWALGGWELNGIFSFSTGLPFTALMGGDPLNAGGGIYDFPNHLNTPGCKSGVNPGNPAQYINVSCFAPANPLTLVGNATRNTLIGPGIREFDFSLFKNMPFPRISERFKAQFRAEAFNIFNHSNFAAPLLSDGFSAIFDGNGNPTGAGQITRTSTTSRQLQFGLKLIW